MNPRYTPVQSSGAGHEADKNARVHRLNLHDTYGVDWDITKVARDFLQNFYDSVPASDFSKKVTIDVNRQEGNVRLQGPTEFDVQYIVRIGVSTKSHQEDRYAGQFGEGFAIAALVAMRDHNVDVTARAGTWKAQFFFDAIRVGEKDVRELCCNVLDSDRLEGSEVVLSKCPASVLSAFEDSRKLFRYDGNPLFGEVLGESPSLGLFIYRSTISHGAIFYRRQKRGDYKLPYIICHDREIKTIKTERDRGDLEAKEVREVVKKSVNCLSGETIMQLIMNDLRSHWEKGHNFITALSDKWISLYPWPHKKLEFPDNYVAKFEWKSDSSTESLGLTLCASTLSCFGLITSREWLRAQAKGKLCNPNNQESKLFSILEDAYTQIVDSDLEDRMFKVFVPENEDDGFEGAYGDKTLILKDTVLVGEFATAIAVFVHEGLHTYGYDGGRKFSDKLTKALEHMCRNRKALDRCEQNWTRIQSGKAFKDGAMSKEAPDSPGDDVPEPEGIEERIASLESQIEQIRRHLEMSE